MSVWINTQVYNQKPYMIIYVIFKCRFRPDFQTQPVYNTKYKSDKKIVIDKSFQ